MSDEEDPGVILYQRNARTTRRGRVVRQYACESCDHVWWSSDPSLVSTCRKCLIKYDPVPDDKMYGWAQFKCECGNKFSGFGQMDTTASECYQCRAMVYPDSVKPPRPRGDIQTESSHSCDAPDCWRHRDSRGGSQTVEGPRCVHPKAKGKKKQVIYPSAPHRSQRNGH